METRIHLGGDGVPFLTTRDHVPDYKNCFPGELKPQPVRKANIDVLDLSNDFDFEHYCKIWEAVGLGIVVVAEESKQFIKSKENWKVFIRWYISGRMDPAELRSTRLNKARRIVDKKFRERDEAKEENNEDCEILY